MTKVVAVMSVSLDGFVADDEGSPMTVFAWNFNGDTPVDLGGPDPLPFRMSAQSAAHFQALSASIGAVLTGRRTFETADGWGGNHVWGPAFVLAHETPAGWPRPDSSVHFVSDGIASAVAQARAAAAGKDVAVHGADTISQCLNAGLLDEVHVDVAAVLLGSGVRLFEHLDVAPVQLGDPTVTPGVGVTHLRYPVRAA